MRDVGDERVDVGDVRDRQDVVDAHAEAAAEHPALADVDGEVRVLLLPVQVRGGVAHVRRRRTSGSRAPAGRARPSCSSRPAGRRRGRDRHETTRRRKRPARRHAGVADDDQHSAPAPSTSQAVRPAVAEVGGDHDRQEDRRRPAQRARHLEQPERGGEEHEEPEEERLLVAEHGLGPRVLVAHGEEDHEALDRLQAAARGRSSTARSGSPYGSRRAPRRAGRRRPGRRRAGSRASRRACRRRARSPRRARRAPRTPARTWLARRSARRAAATRPRSSSG